MKYELIYRMWIEGRSVKEIAKEVGLSEVRVRRVLKTLADEGLVQYPKRERGTSLKHFIEILKGSQ